MASRRKSEGVAQPFRNPLHIGCGQAFAKEAARNEHSIKSAVGDGRQRIAGGPSLDAKTPVTVGWEWDVRRGHDGWLGCGEWNNEAATGTGTVSAIVGPRRNHDDATLLGHLRVHPGHVVVANQDHATQGTKVIAIGLIRIVVEL